MTERKPNHIKEHVSKKELGKIIRLGDTLFDQLYSKAEAIEERKMVVAGALVTACKPAANRINGKALEIIFKKTKDSDETIFIIGTFHPDIKDHTWAVTVFHEEAGNRDDTYYQIKETLSGTIAEQSLVLGNPSREAYERNVRTLQNFNTAINHHKNNI